MSVILPGIVLYTKADTDALIGGLVGAATLGTPNSAAQLDGMGHITLAQLPPESTFVVSGSTTSGWTYNGATITTRPTTRTDLVMLIDTIDGTTPTWMLTTDRILGGAVAAADITDASTVGVSLVTATDAAAARTAIGGAGTASPTLTGTVTVPTVAVGTNNTQAASTAFVAAAVAAGGGAATIYQNVDPTDGEYPSGTKIVNLVTGQIFQQG